MSIHSCYRIRIIQYMISFYCASFPVICLHFLRRRNKREVCSSSRIIAFNSLSFSIRCAFSSLTFGFNALSSASCASHFSLRRFYRIQALHHKATDRYLPDILDNPLYHHRKVCHLLSLKILLQPYYLKN